MHASVVLIPETKIFNTWGSKTLSREEAGQKDESVTIKRCLLTDAILDAAVNKRHAELGSFFVRH